jgi:hypothetical protein
MCEHKNWQVESKTDHSGNVTQTCKECGAIKQLQANFENIRDMINSGKMKSRKRAKDDYNHESDARYNYGPSVNCRSVWTT